MTITNTSEYLLSLLREGAHFYEQVRRLILTDELVNLSARFTASSAHVDDFNANQEQFNERVETRFDRMEGDMSYFKNRFRESQVGKEAPVIAMAMVSP